MLAVRGRPFDSDDHLYEVKWDGTRALVFREGATLRAHNRRLRPLLERYPELDALAALPEGVVLDGEVVVLRDGRPDFPALLSREQARGRDKAEQLARTAPATFVVFDLLYDGYASRMAEPLRDRRARLAELVAAHPCEGLVFSDGVVGGGVRYFEEAVAAGLEGVLAKRLESPYEPGRRSDAWVKLKPVHRLHCLVLGWLPDGPHGLKSLVIATDDGGGLRCVGKVGSGLTAAVARELVPRLEAAPRDRPLVPADVPGARWVEPGLYCVVSCVEFTRSGSLRAPVFLQLVDD